MYLNLKWIILESKLSNFQKYNAFFYFQTEVHMFAN